MQPAAFTILYVKVVLIGFVGYLGKEHFLRSTADPKNQVFDKKSICILKLLLDL
jgi:hypothetical protein